MTAKLLLRAAASLMLLHTIGHIFGTISWKDNPEPRIVNIIRDMESNHYNFMGSNISLAEFYQGYCCIMIILLSLTTVCLWIFSTQSNPLARQMITLFGVFLLAMALLEMIYFFPMAAGMTLFAGILTLASLYAKGNPAV